MKNYALPLQPPFAEKYTFLVDEIYGVGTMGIAREIEKLHYNRQILETYFRVEWNFDGKQIGIEGLKAIPIGPFITVISIQKQHKDDVMLFLDFRDGDFVRIENLVASIFDERVARACSNLKISLELYFSEDDDVVMLDVLEI